MNSSSATPPYVHHRPVTTDEERAQLAVAAQSHPTLHIALERDPDPGRVDSLVDELTGHEAHHDLGTAKQRHRPGRLEWRSGKQHGHDADRTVPTGRADIDRDADVDPGRRHASRSSGKRI